MKGSLHRKKQSAVVLGRLRRKRRIRSIFGTSQTPRLTVYKSNLHLYAQIIDDTKAHTVASVSTLQVESARKNRKGALILAGSLSKDLKSRGIERLLFDRNGYPYHGIIQDFVEQLREEGIRI